MVRLHVDAASPAYDLAAVHRSLEGDTRHTKRFKVACSYDPVPLQVPKQSIDVAGGGRNRIEACYESYAGIYSGRCFVTSEPRFGRMSTRVEIVQRVARPGWLPGRNR